MSKQRVLIDGKPVAVGTAGAYYRLKAMFERAFPGLTLLITYGIREYAEQERIFRQRYVLKGQVNGRKVYDTMQWRGQTWYRISPAGRVAPPGSSLHETGHALDIRDSGKDPGVTAYNNARSRWILNNAAKYGFAPNGYKWFGEPWHIEYQGDPWKPIATPAGEATIKEAEVKVYRRQDTTARKEGRVVAPGGGFYLHRTEGLATSQADNIVGGIGEYSITVHVYAEGTPGDVAEVYLLWQDTKATPRTNSPHYVERIEIGADGTARRNFEFKRAVASGYAVYARLNAPSTNKGNVKVTVFDTDAFLFLA